MNDPYVDPTTGVLRNKLGIHDFDTLSQVEADVSFLRLNELREQRLPGDYDLDHLRSFHHTIFQDIYQWAGELRTVTISKADVFCLPHFIESYSAEVFNNLAAEKQLSGLPRTQFLDRLAHYYADINAIHPFREGNSRAMGVFNL